MGLSQDLLDRIQVDLDRYRDDYASGQIYERLMTHDAETDRQVFKGKFYHALYGRRPERVELIARRYPALAVLIKKLKLINGAAPFAQALQQIEATIVIDRVCGHLLEHRPDIPCLTCHDGILVPERHVEYVRGVLLSSAADLSLPPILNVH